MTPSDPCLLQDTSKVTPAPQILLFSSEASAKQVAQRLAQELVAAVTTVTDQRRYGEILQHKSFTLIVLEEAMALESESTLNTLYDLAAESFVVEVNFGIANAHRIVTQVRAALRRREREYNSARHSALVSLQRDLSASVSGLLLESQLALRTAGPKLAPALEHLVTLAEALCEQLRF